MNIKKFLFLSVIITASACYTHTLSQDLEDYSPREGDIIFQTETIPRAFAIQAATGSRYNHVGVIFKKNGRYHVYEAIGSVQATPLTGFISRNATHNRFTVMRLKEELGDFELRNVRREILNHLGKRYDSVLGWSDARIYCSELIWKAYERGAGVTLSNTRSLNERPVVSILERLVDSQFDLPNINRDDHVVSPGDIARSSHLETVFSNY
tara:strand:- start:91 stop:720 length:630 start_codon:yes stop_codon:yes gene_type:complete